MSEETTPLSVCLLLKADISGGIYKRMEYYVEKAGADTGCHRLRHIMATWLLNVNADLVTIQDLSGNNRFKIKQQYSKVSDLKVKMKRDYL